MVTAVQASCPRKRKTQNEKAIDWPGGTILAQNPDGRVCGVLVRPAAVGVSPTRRENFPGGMPPDGMPPGMPGGNPPSGPNASGKDTGGPWLPSEPPPMSITTNLDGTKITNSPEEIQLSFQGANVDMVVQWLAQTTGKTVIKHPRVQCQLTITSSKKVSKREAIVLVYRALAMEGFSAIESSQSILIVPEGQEPKMSPEVASPQGELPEGRTRLVKVFTLHHIQAVDLRDRIKGALTDKGTIDINERNNQIILTDYTDNIRMAGELIQALDTDKPEDMAVRVIQLKSVGATALAKEIGPLYQKTGGKSLDMAADDRANALIILSSEATYDSIFRLVSSLDTEDAQEKSMETFILKNADAQDVARQLQQLNEASQGSSRYVYYLSPQNDNSQKKFNVVADRRRNAVIVQAAPQRKFPTSQKSSTNWTHSVEDDSLAPKIYPLKYVSAVDLEDVLNELFLEENASRPTYYGLVQRQSVRRLPTATWDASTAKGPHHKRSLLEHPHRHLKFQGKSGRRGRGYQAAGQAIGSRRKHDAHRVEIRQGLDGGDQPEYFVRQERLAGHAGDRAAKSQWREPGPATNPATRQLGFDGF